MSTTETPPPIIPALRKVYAPLAPYAYTFIRVCVGLIIVLVVKFANGFLAFAPKAIQPGFAGMVPGGFEFELLLGLCCLAFLFGGAGRLSLDHAIGKEL